MNRRPLFSLVLYRWRRRIAAAENIYNPHKHLRIVNERRQDCASAAPFPQTSHQSPSPRSTVYTMSYGPPPPPPPTNPFTDMKYRANSLQTRLDTAGGLSSVGYPDNGSLRADIPMTEDEVTRMFGPHSLSSSHWNAASNLSDVPIVFGRTSTTEVQYYQEERFRIERTWEGPQQQGQAQLSQQQQTARPPQFQQSQTSEEYDQQIYSASSYATNQGSGTPYPHQEQQNSGFRFGDHAPTFTSNQPPGPKSGSWGDPRGYDQSLRSATGRTVTVPVPASNQVQVYPNNAQPAPSGTWTGSAPSGLGWRQHPKYTGYLLDPNDNAGLKQGWYEYGAEDPWVYSPSGERFIKLHWNITNQPDWLTDPNGDWHNISDAYNHPWEFNEIVDGHAKANPR